MAAPLLAESPGTISDRSFAGNDWLVDYVVTDPPRPTDMATLLFELDGVIEADLAGAQVALGGTDQDFLLAALGRTIARTIGDGVLAVEVADGTGQYRVANLPCDSRRDVPGDELLAGAQRALADAGRAPGSADVRFAVGADGTAGQPDPGHRLTLQVHRACYAVHLDWRYDTRSFDRNTIRELAEQFAFALIEVTSG